MLQHFLIMSEFVKPTENISRHQIARVYCAWVMGIGNSPISLTGAEWETFHAFSQAISYRFGFEIIEEGDNLFGKKKRPVFDTESSPEIFPLEELQDFIEQMENNCNQMSLETPDIRILFSQIKQLFIKKPSEEVVVDAEVRVL